MHRPWRRRNRLLSVGLLELLQGRDVSGQLILLGRLLILVGLDLTYATAHDGDIERNELYLLRQLRQNIRFTGCLWGSGRQHAGKRRHPEIGDFRRLITVGLPRQRQTDTDQDRHDKASDSPEYSSSDWRPTRA